MNYPLDIAALIASFLALYFTVRAKRTYFLDSSFFIAVANIGFIAYLADATYANIVGGPVNVGLDVMLAAIMATSIGFASYLLKNNDQRASAGILELKRFISRPPTQFLIFIGVVWAWAIAALALQPWGRNQTNISGTEYYYYTYSAWFFIASIFLLFAFYAFPVLSFYQQSHRVHEKSASLAIKIISFCWIFFGLSLFAQVIGGFLLQTGQSIGFVVDSLLFVLMSFALREPGVLARIISAGQNVSEVVSLNSANDTIFLYNTQSDRKRLVETFVKDSIASGQKVVCRVTRGEIPFYRAVIKTPELAKFNNVTVEPIDSDPNSGTRSTTEALSHRCRELVDLDDLGLEQSREIIYNITADDKTDRGSAGRIWAVNEDAAQGGILNILNQRNPQSKVVDLARQQDTFSSLLGLRHQGILGTRVLLEYEPTSRYEEVVQKFVREFQANVEPVAIFTSGGSPIYRQFNRQRNIRLFSSSTKASTPTRLSDEQVLLPERDTSLLLDAVDKLLQANNGRRIGIVFEVFTYLILSLGFEKAYGVVSSIVEMSESELATILVLVNYEALEPKVLAGMRGLFQSQLQFNSEGLKPTRLEKGESGQPNTQPSPEIDHQDASRRVGL